MWGTRHERSPRVPARAKLDGFIPKSSLDPGGKKIDEPFQTSDGLLTAEQDEHLKQTWTGGSTGHRDPGGVDEHTGFNTPLSCRSTHRCFHMWLVEGIQSAQYR